MSTALSRFRISIARVAALGAVLLSLPSPAHHSTANFDMAKSNTVTGTVAYFAFTNPHSYFDSLGGGTLTGSSPSGTPEVG